MDPGVVEPVTVTVTGSTWADGAPLIGWTLTKQPLGRTVGGFSTGTPTDGVTHQVSTIYPGKDRASLTSALLWVLGTDDGDTVDCAERVLDDVVMGAVDQVHDMVAAAVAAIRWVPAPRGLPAPAPARARGTLTLV